MKINGFNIAYLLTKYFEELVGGKVPVVSFETLSQNFKEALASKDGEAINSALLKIIKGVNPHFWSECRDFIRVIAKPEVVEDFGELSYREALLVCNTAGRTLEALFNNLIDCDLDHQDNVFNVMHHL